MITFCQNWFNLGHENIAKLLIAKGVDVNAKSTSGNSPIFYSAKNGNLEYFLTYMEIHWCLSIGHYRASHILLNPFLGHESVTKLLIDNGAVSLENNADANSQQKSK